SARRPRVDRPIAYDKLAREDRFVRMRAREVGELKVEQGLPPFPDLASRESIRERVHGIMVGELQAMEGAGRTVYDFPDAPWEFTLDMARQVWDESRHVETYLGLLEHLGGRVGEFPESTILWRCACAEDAAARVAGVNRGLEGLACDVFNQLIHIAQKIGDPIIEKSVDYVLADEITHVRMGSRWLNELTRGDPERRRKAIEFQETIDERFNLGGTRQDGHHDAGAARQTAVRPPRVGLRAARRRVGPAATGAARAGPNLRAGQRRHDRVHAAAREPGTTAANTRADRRRLRRAEVTPRDGVCAPPRVDESRLRAADASHPGPLSRRGAPPRRRRRGRARPSHS